MNAKRNSRISLIVAMVGIAWLVGAGSAWGAVFTVDDGDAGYTPTGAWTQESTTWAYNSDEWYQSTPNNGASATWSFTGLPSGKYYLAASYLLNANRTDNAHYAISDGIPAADVNQKPNVYDLGGSGGQGIYTRLSSQPWSITDGTLDVTVTNTGTGYLMADSIRLETAAPDALEVYVVDDRYTFEGRPGYSRAGTWGEEQVNHTDSEDWSNDPAATATFDFTGLPDGYYRVSTTWKESPNRSTDAVYTMTDGAGVSHVNQQIDPTDKTFDNVGWRTLDPVVHITDGTFTAVLSNNNTPNFIMADAVRLERFAAKPGATIRNPSFQADQLADGGWTGTATAWSDNWATNNNSGAYNPPPGTGPALPPDGANVGFVNRNGWLAQYLQTLDGGDLALSAGDVLVVTLDAVSRGGLAGGLLDVDVRTPGNVSLIGGLQQQVVAADDFTTLSYYLTVGAEEATPLLVIQNSTVDDQLWVDNVSIEHYAVPEPATMALLGLAAAAMGGYVRKRRK